MLTTKQALDGIQTIINQQRALKRIEEILATASAAEQLEAEAKARLAAVEAKCADVVKRLDADAGAISLAKTEAEAVIAKAKLEAESLLSSAKADADAIREKAGADATVLLVDASEREANFKRSASLLAAEVKEKTSELAEIEKRLSKARDSLRELAKGV